MVEDTQQTTQIIGEIKKEKNSFIFGDIFGGLMQKTSMRFQMESMMAGLFMVMIGLLITCVYIIGWTDFALFFKIMTGINTFFGLLILYSNLVGAFQAYQTMLQAQAVQDMISSMTSDLNKNITTNV